MDQSIIAKTLHSIVTTTFLGVQIWQYVLSVLIIILSFPVKRWIEIHVIRNVLEKVCQSLWKISRALI
jgi:hypothetical protein